MVADHQDCGDQGGVILRSPDERSEIRERQRSCEAIAGLRYAQSGLGIPAMSNKPRFFNYGGISRQDHQNIMYAPVGRCIYCDRTDDLSREHIIPFFIAGGWVLQRASCPACAKITMGFERICGRDMLGNLRDQFGFSTRRKRDRAARFADGLPNPRTGGKFFPFCLPEYNQPGALSEAAKVPDFGDMHFVIVFPSVGESGRTAAPEKSVVCVNPFAFARMLAKIGFAFSVAQLGLDKTPKDLRPYILGDDPCISHVVGACAYPYPPPPPMVTDGKGNLQFEPFLMRHGILRHNGRHWLMAQIQLLRSFNTPTYWAIVGPSTVEIEAVVEAPGPASGQ